MRARSPLIVIICWVGNGNIRLLVAVTIGIGGDFYLIFFL